MDNAAVLAEASAHVWLPVIDAVTEGIEELAKWTAGERSGPISILYHPILNTNVTRGEVPKPKRLFEMLE